MLNHFAIILAIVLAISQAQSGRCQSQYDKSLDRYIVQFPNDIRVADITVRDQGGQAGKSKDRRLIAHGTVAIPANCALNVELLYDGPTHMETIEQLDAHLITEFSAAKLEFDDRQFAHLKKFKNLATLDLNSTLVSDQSLPLIGSFPELWRLRLNNTDITGSGFDALRNLHKLSKLDIEGIGLKQGTIAKLKPLAASLTSIDFAKSGLTKVDMLAIGDLHNLTHLDVSGNKLVDDSCLKYLQPLHKLVVLNITDTAVTEKSLPDIDRLPSLKTVIIRNSQFWISGKPQKSKAGITFRDASTDTRVPIYMFGPLH
jgi:hypothetical protein